MKRIWPSVELGQLCSVEGGNAAPQDPEDFRDGTIPFVRMKDLGRYHFTDSLDVTDDRLREDAVQKHRLRVFDPGCILFPRSGSVFLNHRAILGVQAVIVSHIGILSDFSQLVNSRYLFRYLQSFDMTRLSKKTTGVDSIAFSDVKRISVPLPPLDCQSQIVEILDSADGLLSLRAVVDMQTAEVIPATFYKMFGDPITNPRRWPIMQLGELVRNCDSRRKPVRASERREKQGTFPYYGASGIIDHVDEFLFDETTLLVAEDGANLVTRSTPIAFIAKGKYWVNNHAHVLSFNGKAELEFLEASLNLRSILDFVTGSAQPKLNQANLNRIPIAIPPVQLQHEFIKRVTDVREIQREQVRLRHLIESLFQSLLQQAFDGEL